VALVVEAAWLEPGVTAAAACWVLLIHRRCVDADSSWLVVVLLQGGETGGAHRAVLHYELRDRRQPPVPA